MKNEQKKGSWFMASRKNDNGSKGEGFKANGSVSISEKVAMGLLSLLLSIVSFVGGYIYGTQKEISTYRKSGQVEEVSLLPTGSTTKLIGDKPTASASRSHPKLTQ